MSINNQVTLQETKRKIAEYQKLQQFWDIWRLRWKYIFNDANDEKFQKKQQAIQSAISIAIEAVQNLEELTVQHPEDVRHQARKECYWPVRANLRPVVWKRMILPMLQSLELGKEAFLAMDSSSHWHLGSDSSNIIANVLRDIHNARSLMKLHWAQCGVKTGNFPRWWLKAAKLPEGPPWKNVEKWWEVFEIAFKSKYPNFEENKILRRLVFSEEKISKGEVGSLVYPSQVRKAILKSFKRTFLAMLNFR